MTDAYDIIGRARSLCVEIAGRADESDDNEVYGSIEVVDILSSEVIRLREQLEQAKETGRQLFQQAQKAEADNAALRAENARLLQLVLSPGTIPFNWRELEAENAVLLTLIRSISYRLNGGLHDSITKAIAAECDALLAGKKP